MNKKERAEQGERDYPGVAVNNADHARADKSLVDERTKTLNNNLRNTDVQMP